MAADGAPGGTASGLAGVGHSSVLKEKEFLPWLPFANHHHSRPVQVCVVCSVVWYVVLMVYVLQCCFCVCNCTV